MGARPLDDPERCEMRRLPLHINQPSVTVTQEVHERQERNFGRIRDTVKHRLTCKQTTDSNPVQPTNQFSVEPGLDAVNPSQRTEPNIGIADLRIDPIMGPT